MNNSNNNGVYQIVYTSSATKPLSTQEIKALELAASERNLKLDITGLLIYQNGKFLQFLEGPKNQVETLFSSIELDKRHQAINFLRHEPIVKRQFTDWYMKYINVDSIKDNEGFIYKKLFDLNTNSIQELDSAFSSLNLLLNFKKNYSNYSQGLHYNC